VLVQTASVPLGVLQRPTAQLQRGGFQGAQDLLRHHVINACGLEAVAPLLRRFVEVSGAPVITLAMGSIIRFQATAAVGADDEAGEQRGAVARAPLSIRSGTMLTQALLIS